MTNEEIQEFLGELDDLPLEHFEGAYQHIIREMNRLTPGLTPDEFEEMYGPVLFELSERAAYQGSCPLCAA